VSMNTKQLIDFFLTLTVSQDHRVQIKISIAIPHLLDMMQMTYALETMY
jgi:hypothetical protein